MCHSEFSKVLLQVDGKEDRMILCRKQDFENLSERKRQRLFRNAFPSIKSGSFSRKIIKYQVVSCYKDYSSQFDDWNNFIERENDWNKVLFVSLWIFERNKKMFCRVRPTTSD
jgi:hypothetical protein